MEGAHGADALSEKAATMLTRERAEVFLYREAQFVDEHRFDEWFALWDTAEVTYWIPANQDVIDPNQQVSIVYEHREQIQERLTRLKSKGAHAQQPRSRMRRVVSNVMIESDDGALAQVEANFILHEVRRSVATTYGGRIVYRLRYDAHDIRMVSKTVLLVNNGEYLSNLTFLL
jgi:3-phenylpropionate/cinnamic acid dioxygenase small subunit